MTQKKLTMKNISQFVVISLALTVLICGFSLKNIAHFHLSKKKISNKASIQIPSGESVTGTNLPNLTYMLGFDNEEAQKAAWQKFVKHPDWIALKSKPEYADKKILCVITNILLKPAPYSQI